VAAGDLREDGDVHDAEGLDAADAEVRVDDGVVVGAHAAGAGGVVERLGVAPDVLGQGLFVVRADVGVHGFAHVGLEGLVGQ
jgi:hypothetical protein